jgi:hypothetical protein
MDHNAVEHCVSPANARFGRALVPQDGTIAAAEADFIALRCTATVGREAVPQARDTTRLTPPDAALRDGRAGGGNGKRGTRGHRAHSA